jgi:hypothetical protein
VLEEPLSAVEEAEGLAVGLAEGDAVPAPSVRLLAVFSASLSEALRAADEDDGALGAVLAPGSGAVDALALGVGSGDVVVGEGVGSDEPPPGNPPSRSPTPSTTPPSRSGSDVVALGLGVGDAVVADFGSAEAVGSVAFAECAEDPEDPEDAVALGVGVLPEPSDALGLALGSGVAVPDPSSPLAVLSVGDGVSDWLTQGPALNVLDGWSSACARCGVSPMPMSTAVGMAASATAFPAGTCSLVSSDLRGAAWRGPEDLVRDPLPFSARPPPAGC